MPSETEALALHLEWCILGELDAATIDAIEFATSGAGWSFKAATSSA
jgi:hypothetical protein